MSRSLLEFIHHIHDECEYIMKATKNKSYESFIEDETLKRAVVRSLEIIGEAVKRLDDDFRIQYNQMNWKKIAGTRDVMIHHYFGIDYEIVWDIIKNKIPELEQYTSFIIEDLKGD